MTAPSVLAQTSGKHVLLLLDAVCQHTVLPFKLRVQADPRAGSLVKLQTHLAMQHRFEGETIHASGAAAVECLG